MKFQLFALATMIAIATHGQDPFRNLDFEGTSLPQTAPLGLVNTTDALPQWSAFDGSSNPLAQIGYRAQFAGTPVALFATNGLTGTSIEGGFSVYLVGAGVNFPGGALPFTPAASITQTGLVPKKARYIFFKAQPGTSVLTVSLGGVNIPCAAVAIESNHTMFAGDVSSFAGQSVELKFTVGYRGTGWNLDSIGFSSQAILAASLVAAEGDLVTNGVTLHVSGSPAIDGAGEVAFRAVLDGKTVSEKNRIAIVAYSNGAPAIIVRTGDIDPITGAVFNQLSDPILSSTGILVFLGSLKPGTGDATKTNSTGIWEYKNGSLSLIARAGAKTPSYGTLPASFFLNFKQIAVNDWGGVVFTASVQGAGLKYTQALFASHFSGGLFLSEFPGEEITDYGFPGLVVEFGVLKPLPHVCGQGRTLARNGDFIESPKFRGLPYDTAVLRPFHFGLFFQKDDETDELGGGYPGGDPFYPHTAQFKLHEAIINNSNQMVVRATVVDKGYTPTNNTVIATVPDATFNDWFQFLARTGDAAPDASGTTGDATYSKLGDPVLNNNGHVAFLASVRGPKNSNTLGIWSDADGIMKRIVAQGDVEPGSGAKFQDFDQIVLPDVGGVIIEGGVSGSGGRKQGLWAVGQNGELQRLLLNGDTLDFHGSLKTLKRFRIFEIPPHFAGQTRSFDPGTGSLVLQAIFSDGSWGIYRITYLTE